MSSYHKRRSLGTHRSVLAVRLPPWPPQTPCSAEDFMPFLCVPDARRSLECVFTGSGSSFFPIKVSVDTCHVETGQERSR